MCPSMASRCEMQGLWNLKLCVFLFLVTTTTMEWMKISLAKKAVCTEYQSSISFFNQSDYQKLRKQNNIPYLQSIGKSVLSCNVFGHTDWHNCCLRTVWWYQQVTCRNPLMCHFYFLIFSFRNTDECAEKFLDRDFYCSIVYNSKNSGNNINAQIEEWLNKLWYIQSITFNVSWKNKMR